ncbi:DUF427 domain-containing protein [Gaiella sp.]|uniref:DUF427 domain-containing protein n=3 Tax=Gaiella sp. TaxID=2663207 RepID=UPI0039830D2F
MESVWDYPRPPRLEPVSKRLQVTLGGVVIADTARGHRVLETSHPPVYYFPLEDITPEALVPSTKRGSMCEWKGAASYYDVVGGTGRRVEGGAWTYRSPTPAFDAIRDAVAFYPAPMDSCTVAGERVTPQPGGFYGGWITIDLVGPYKGEPGTMGW